MWNFCLKLWLSGTTYLRDSKPVPLDSACLKPNIHASQAILMHFFPVKINKLWNICLQFVIFSGNDFIIETWNKCHWFSMLQPLTICLSSHFNAFSKSKSTKCEIFACNLWFFRNDLSYRLEISAIGFSMPSTLTICLSSHFNAFSKSKSTKCEIFAWNCDFQEPLILETQNLCHWIQHASNPIYMPLKPFWCIFPSQINKLWNICLQFVIFQEWLIIETWNKCHWIQHAFNPNYMPLKPFQCIFQVKINKMWNFCLNCDFSGITYPIDLKPAPLDLAFLKP